MTASYRFACSLRGGSNLSRFAGVLAAHKKGGRCFQRPPKV